MSSLVAQRVKNLSALQEKQVQSLDQKDLPGEGNSNPLQFLAWEIPRTEEFGGYNPRGRKELDTTEPLTLFTFTCQLLNIPAHSSF